MSSMTQFLMSIAKEPPFRVLARATAQVFPCSLSTKVWLDAVSYVSYAKGILYAASQAQREGVDSFSVVEFGVAGGNGLLAMQRFAHQVERETGIQIAVYGFDTGQGLPEPCGDHRDHPDWWQSTDYPMDYSELSQLLSENTELILGDLAETLPRFVSDVQRAPLGFVSVDVDYYSSTRDALRLLALPECRRLRRVAMYFDDTYESPGGEYHAYAGELLAIHEFNQENASIKIDRWRGIAHDRPFPNSAWLNKMYLAHDLAAISKAGVQRVPLRLDL
jgi:hypothetical protein